MNGKVKLVLAGTVMAIAVSYVAFLGLSTTWEYYLLVDECGGQVDKFRGKRLRVSGRVEKGSLYISPDRRETSFRLAGDKYSFAVSCSGPLPDNLADCMDVVVEGELRGDGHLRGQRVITRCASKYAPKESVVSGQ
jgi:cytochrome c-type biogenesis protein CcmE